MSALDELFERARCMVDEGDRDAESIIRECYDLECSDWFLWELLQAVFNPSDLLSDGVEEQLIDYCIGELGDEVESLIDDAVAKEEDKEEAETVWYDLDIDEDLIGNREQDVYDNLGSVIDEMVNGHELYTFFHEDGEHKCVWDETQRRFVG